MKRFILTPRAKQDVNDIWEYIANDNIEAADRVLNALDNAMIKLAKNPGLGHWRDERSLTDRGAASQAAAPALMPAPGWRVKEGRDESLTRQAKVPAPRIARSTGQSLAIGPSALERSWMMRSRCLIAVETADSMAIQ